MTVLIWPNAPVSSIRRTLRTAVAGSASPFTLTEQMQDWGGEAWEYEIDVPPQDRRAGKALEAFFNQLRGRAGRFVFTDPSLRNDADLGAPVVSLARRNLLDYTEAFNNNVWGKNGGGVASAPIVTPNAGLSPLGDLTADRLQLSLNGGTTTNDRSDLPQNKPSVTGQPFTFSVWLKSFDGNPYTVQFSFNGQASQNFVVIDEWKRFSALNPSSLDNNRNPFIRLRGAQGTSNTADVLGWGAQFEAGPLSEYQPILGTTYTPPGARANMLPTAGWSGPLKAGAFFSLGTEGNTRLYQLTRDVTPSADGRADVYFQPRLRFAPVDGEPLEVNSPKALLRLNGPTPSNISTAQNYTFSVQGMEAI